MGWLTWLRAGSADRARGSCRALVDCRLRRPHGRPLRAGRQRAGVAGIHRKARVGRWNRCGGAWNRTSRCDTVCAPAQRPGRGAGVVMVRFAVETTAQATEWVDALIDAGALPHQPQRHRHPQLSGPYRAPVWVPLSVCVVEPNRTAPPAGQRNSAWVIPPSSSRATNASRKPRTSTRKRRADSVSS